MLNHQMFGNGGFQNNGFFDPNLVMINMNNFGQNTQNSHQQNATKNQGNGTNSSSKKVIMIENIDEDE